MFLAGGYFFNFRCAYMLAWLVDIGLAAPASSSGKQAWSAAPCLAVRGQVLLAAPRLAPRGRALPIDCWAPPSCSAGTAAHSPSCLSRDSGSLWAHAFLCWSPHDHRHHRQPCFHAATSSWASWAKMPSMTNQFKTPQDSPTHLYRPRGTPGNRTV